MNFARVDSADAEELIIGAGEAVLLPRNDLHLIGSDLSPPPVAGVNIIHALKGGGLTRSSFPFRPWIGRAPSFPFPRDARRRAAGQQASAGRRGNSARAGAIGMGGDKPVAAPQLGSRSNDGQSWFTASEHPAHSCRLHRVTSTRRLYSRFRCWPPKHKLATVSGM